MGKLRNKYDINIDFNAIASDIIISDYMDEGYTNIMMGTSSHYLGDCVRDKKGFVIYKSNKPIMYARCAFYDKKYDALVISDVYFENGTWKEEKRSVFWREDEKIFYDGDLCPIGHARMDIGAQTFVVGEGREMYAVPNHYDPYYFFNIPSRWIEETYAFFGNDFLCNSTLGLHFEKDTSLNRLARRCYDENGITIEKGCIFTKCDFDSFVNSDKKSHYITEMSDDMPKLPKKAYKMMEQYVKEDILCCAKDGSKIDEFMKNSFALCCLSACGEDVCQRFFRTVITIKYPYKNSVVKMIETGRHILKKGGNEVSIFENAPIIYTDDLSKTFIGHMDFMIKGWTSLVEKSLPCNKINDISETYEATPDDYTLSKTRDWYYDKYGFYPDFVTHVAKILSENPFMERLYKAEYVGCKNMRKWLYQYIIKKKWEDSDLPKILGEITGNGAIHSMLGLPKGLLEYAAEKNEIKHLKPMKELFFEKEWKKYLMRMNLDDAKELFDGVVQIVFKDTVHEPVQTALSCMEKLFMFRGCENWKNYLAHMKGIPVEEITVYSQYLDMLLVIGEPVKDYEWRLSGEKLLKAHDALIQAYQIAISPEKQVKDFMIKKRAEELSDMAYNNDLFKITWPKSTDDIINEGAALNHCAKNFVDKVAKRQTILFFIRRMTKPDKPFFTLEVRNGTIRQCHGVNNCNIDSTPELETFLKEFCKEKGIEFKNTDNLLDEN